MAQTAIDLTGDNKVTKLVKTEGKGITPTNGMHVFVHYTGYLKDTKKVFDSSLGKPHRAKYGFYFRLGAGEVITGWDIGFSKMKVGEKALLTIAGSHAYGARGAPSAGIPPNATLCFDVHLLDARKLSKQELKAINDEVQYLRNNPDE